MRHINRLLLTAMLLLGGAFSFASPAIAAPAEPFSIGPTCSDLGGGTLACSTSTGVEKVEETPSGNTLYKFSGTRTDTVTANGDVKFEDVYQFNMVFIAKDGVTQAAHGNARQTVLSDGFFECRFQSNFTFANGELRHSVSEGGCTPVGQD